jgi:hypothetical protein
MRTITHLGVAACRPRSHWHSPSHEPHAHAMPLPRASRGGCGQRFQRPARRHTCSRGEVATRACRSVWVCMHERRSCRCRAGTHGLQRETAAAGHRCFRCRVPTPPAGPGRACWLLPGAIVAVAARIVVSRPAIAIGWDRVRLD